MGVNCINVRKVINFGAPDNVDDYIQQTGRVGRDGLQSEAILLWSSNNILYSSDRMKDYCKLSDECRRDFLFSDYDNYNKGKDFIKEYCCDIYVIEI